jgi:hypothetical protein
LLFFPHSARVMRVDSTGSVGQRIAGGARAGEPALPIATGTAAGRLHGWKQIAGAVGVDARTVKRWEQSRGLPVRRVPGNPRAPVFVFRDELAAWLASRDGEPDMAVEAAPGRPERRWWMWGLLAAAVLAAGLALYQYAARSSASSTLTADARRLGDVAALADRLDKQPGTVAMRAALAGEAATLLGRVAAQPEASTALKREAAAAYLRLARVQNSTNRPSLRDLGAAKASLAAGARLLAADGTRAGRHLHAELLLEQASAAALSGDTEAALQHWKAAIGLAADAPPPLQEALALVQAEITQWRGAYAISANQAEAVIRPLGGQDIDGWLRQLRARDLAAEGHYYAGAMPRAISRYQDALAGALVGAKRWPAEPQLAWAVRRQEWNLGSTLADAGQPQAALPYLRAARDGWLALAAADPQDQSLAWWGRVARLSYGEALGGAGQHDAAIIELGISVAERRAAIAAQPGNADRQRALLAGLDGLARVEVGAGRFGRACAHYGEALALAAGMARAGQLSPLDKDSVITSLAAGERRHCAG